MVFTPWETAHGDADRVFLTVADVVAISPADDSVDTNTVVLTGIGTISSFGECPYIVTKLVHFVPATAPARRVDGVEHQPPQVVDPLAPQSTITTNSSPAVGGTTTGDGTYPRGSVVTVIATPNANYTFANWIYKNGLEASTDATYSFVLNSNTDLSAQFEPATIRLVHSPLLTLLPLADRLITSEAYGEYRCHGQSDWSEISFVAVGADPGALFAALDRRISVLEARLQEK